VDVGIGLFLPSLDGVPWLTRYQRSFPWGGISYPQVPIYYRVGEISVFRLCSGDPLLAEFFPEEVGFDRTEWAQLIVTNEGLQAFES
jgi:hypothetical protein